MSRQQWYTDARKLDQIQFAISPQDGLPDINRINVHLRRGEFTWARCIYLDTVHRVRDPHLRRTLEHIFGCQAHCLTNCQQCGLQSKDNLLELRRRLHLGPET